MKSVGTILIENLKNFGVKHVFGVPGKAISPLVLEADKRGMHYVLCRHEGGAGYAAAGYSLGNGCLGVAIGTSGPGGTNMLTSAAQAKAFGVPVLFITGHPSVKNTGKALVQDSSIFGTDLVKMFEPVTLFSARVERGDHFPLYFQHAVEKACIGIRGPVHLSIPSEILMENIPDFQMDYPVSSPTVFSGIDKILPMLEAAQNPVMLLGKGVQMAKAYEEVQRLSEQWQIPVMTTPSGKGSFPTHHPLSLGGIGVAGSAAVYERLRSGVDLMLVLGTKLSDMALAGLTPEVFPKQVIHFDHDPTFIRKSIPVPTLAVLGDLKCNLQHLVNKSGNNTAFQQAAATMSSECLAEETHGKGYMSAVQTMRTLRKHIAKDALIISDSGSHSFYAVKYLDTYMPGTFYFDDILGAMGHAIGMSVGLKLAQPKRTVVCITGDGCLMMHGTEISTAVCNEVPVIYIAMNNKRLDMVEKAMKYAMGHVVGAVYETPLNAAEFGRSLGAAAFCCQSEKDIENALQFAADHKGPTVIEVMLDPDEIPPTLSREK